MLFGNFHKVVVFKKRWRKKFEFHSSVGSRNDENSIKNRIQKNVVFSTSDRCRFFRCWLHFGTPETATNCKFGRKLSFRSNFRSRTTLELLLKLILTHSVIHFEGFSRFPEPLCGRHNMASELCFELIFVLFGTRLW